MPAVGRLAFSPDERWRVRELLCGDVRARGPAAWTSEQRGQRHGRSPPGERPRSERRRPAARTRGAPRAGRAAARQAGHGPARRRRARPRAAHRARQAAAARPRRRPARSRLPLPGAGPAGRRRDVRRRGPGRRSDRRHRPGLRPRVRDRRQRRHGQGRHLLPDDGQEAPARPGDRAGRTGCRASTSSTPAAPSCRMQDEVFPDREHFGRIFYNQATHVGARASRRSPRCSAPARRAAPTSRR